MQVILKEHKNKILPVVHDPSELFLPRTHQPRAGQSRGMGNNANEWKYKMAQPCWEIVRGFLMKLNIVLPYAPAIVLLGIYPNEF